MTVRSRIRLWIAGVTIALTVVVVQTGVHMAAVVGQRSAITAASSDLAALSRYDARITASEGTRLEPTDPSWAAWSAMAGPGSESVDRARSWLDRIDHVALGSAAADRSSDLRWYVRKAASELRAASAATSTAMADSWSDMARGLLLAYILLFSGAAGWYMLKSFPTAGITVVTSQRSRRQPALIKALPGLELAHVRHELRTPLTVMIGYASELESQLEGDLKEFAATIHQAGSKLHDTLEELLTYAELADDGRSIKTEPVEIHAVVEQVIRRLRPQAFEKRLSFVYRATKTEAWVSSNPESLETAVSNLVENALKYTEAGSVVVGVDAENGRVRVSVEDTGIGFEEGRLEEFSRPFQQGSTGDARNHEGMGLGLTISRRVAEASGGRLTASSVPGIGSRFTLTLPRLAEEGTERRAA